MLFVMNRVEIYSNEFAAKSFIDNFKVLRGNNGGVQFWLATKTVMLNQGPLVC